MKLFLYRPPDQKERKNNNQQGKKIPKIMSLKMALFRLKTKQTSEKETIKNKTQKPKPGHGKSTPGL